MKIFLNHKKNVRPRKRKANTEILCLLSDNDSSTQNKPTFEKEIPAKINRRRKFDKKIL